MMSRECRKKNKRFLDILLSAERSVVAVAGVEDADVFGSFVVVLINGT